MPLARFWLYRVIMKAITVIAALAALGTTSFFASANPGGDERRPPREPPAFAIAACEGKSAGDACTVKTPRGHTIEGECTQMGDVLACKPDHPPPRRGGRDGEDGPPGPPQDSE